MVSEPLFKKVVDVLADESGDVEHRMKQLQANAMIVFVSVVSLKVGIWKETWDKLEPYHQGQFDRLICQYMGVKHHREVFYDIVPTSTLSH